MNGFANHVLVVQWQADEPHFRVLSDMCMVRSAAAGGFVVIILMDLWAQYGETHVQTACEKGDHQPPWMLSVGSRFPVDGHYVRFGSLSGLPNTKVIKKKEKEMNLPLFISLISSYTSFSLLYFLSSHILLSSITSIFDFDGFPDEEILLSLIFLKDDMMV